jgi:hypothetical protein
VSASSPNPPHRWATRGVGLAVLLVALLLGALLLSTVAPLLKAPTASVTPRPTPVVAVTIGPAGREPDLITTSLPVNDCVIRSVLGTPPAAPAAVEARVPTTDSRLAAYWTGKITVLAPRGWDCQVDIAQDGSWQGKIIGATGGGSLNFTVFPGSPAIDLADLACPLFPAAATAMAGYGQPCTLDAPPPDELDSWLIDPTAVRFEDKPGVIGIGAGSGAALRAIGAIVYVPRVLAGQLTCLLPEDQGDECEAVIRDFAGQLTK